MEKVPLTIINDQNIRGILAPSKMLSKKLLEDIIDIVEWSRPEVIRETEARIRKADRENSWIPFEKIYAKYGRARRTR